MPESALEIFIVEKYGSLLEDEANKARQRGAMVVYTAYDMRVKLKGLDLTKSRVDLSGESIEACITSAIKLLLDSPVRLLTVNLAQSRSFTEWYDERFSPSERLRFLWQGLDDEYWTDPRFETIPPKANYQPPRT